METILFLAHAESNGTLSKPALEALGAATSLAKALDGAQLVAGLIGAEIDAAANQIGGCGAARVLGVSGADFAAPRYASDAAAAEAICRAAEATIVVVPGTSRFTRVVAGVAHRLGGRVDTHTTGVAVGGDGAPTVARWYYRQRMEAVLKRAARPWVVVVDPGSGTPWEGEAGAATVEAVAVELGDAAQRTKVTGIEEPAGDEQTIRPDAELLFVAGAGWTKKQADGELHAKDADELILAFIGKAQASLGGSKSIVDMGGEGEAVLSCMSHLNQIGQTGATPRHAKGLATCCHGEEPHVVGWRFIGERRAINLDAGCGWAQGKADVLYVADAFEVMAKVNELLSS